MSPLTSADEGDIDTQMLQDLVLGNQATTEDSEMLGMSAITSHFELCSAAI
jgi:hypothetical protein